MTHPVLKKIRGLNGLRALAVICVFVQHKATVPFVDLGKLGVWLFFGLSGFLITGILNRQRDQCDRGNSDVMAELKRFFYRRTIRIFPLYYLTLLLCAIVFAAGTLLHKTALTSWLINGGSKALTFHVLYLSNIYIGIVAGHFVGPLTHFWSLAVEEQFYLLFAPLLLLIPAKQHLRVCIALFVCGALLQFCFRATQANAIFVYTFPLNNFAVMLAGGVCFFIGRELPERALQSSFALLLPLALILLALLRTPLHLNEYPAVNGVLDIALMIACPLVVLWIASNQQSKLVAALEYRPIAYMGAISYGFYVFHNFAQNPGHSRKFAALLRLTPSSHAAMAVGLVFTFALPLLLAHLSWKYFEHPILLLKERNFGRNAPAKPATQQALSRIHNRPSANDEGAEERRVRRLKAGGRRADSE